MKNQLPGKFSAPLITTAAVIVIIAGVMQARSIILPIMLAFFISVICAPPVNWLARKKVPRLLAIFIVLIAVILIVFLLGGAIGSSLAGFSKNASAYAANLNRMLDSVFNYLSEKGISVSDKRLSSQLEPGKIMTFTASVLGELGGLMSNMILIFFIIIFILLEIGSFPVKVDAISSNSARTRGYLAGITRGIRHYMGIKTLTSFLTGAAVWLWLTIVGVNYPLLWGVLAFLFNYIPNIGSIIAAVPAVLLSLIQLGWTGALWTGGGYLAVNMLIGNVVEPRIMGKGMGLSTLVVFLSLIVWGYILGGVGMFLSVPLTMIAKIVLEHNPRTRWLAVILGTKEDALRIRAEKTGPVK